MRVERAKEKFNPITITIESLEEAVIMWAALNVPMTHLKAQCPEVAQAYLDGVAVQAMFGAFNEKFNPRFPFK